MTSFLIDIDGVLVRGNTAIPGARETISFLGDSCRCLLVTNTTRLSPRELFAKLVRIGFAITPEQIFTQVDATIAYIKREKAGSKCQLIMEGDARRDFEEAGLVLTEENPDFVVLGLNARVDYPRLNKAFRNLMEGARFVAGNVTRFYPEEGGLYLGAGPFVKALEYATGKEAVVIGKPNPEFFQAALTGWRQRMNER